MEKINWRRVRNGLNKAVFNRHFWEAADVAFSEASQQTKHLTRQIFGLQPSGGVIRVVVSSSGVCVNDSNIGHRAKRSIIRKVGRYLRDEVGLRAKLGKCDESLAWRKPVSSEELQKAEDRLRSADLEYLGWSLSVKGEYY